MMIDQHRVSDFGECSGHHGYEFFIADSSITILVGVVDHLINFGRAEAFSDLVADSFEIFRSKAVGSLRIKHVIEFFKG